MPKNREDLEDILDEDDEDVHESSKVNDKTYGEDDDEDEEDGVEEEGGDKEKESEDDSSEDDSSDVEDKDGKKGEDSEPEDSDGEDSKAFDSSDEDEDEEARREERRQARREKKQRQREAREAKDRLITTLQRQVQDLSGRVAVVDRRGHQHEIAQIDQAIDAHERAIRAADAKIGEAMTKRDGQAFTAAQNARDELRSRLDKLRTAKKGLSKIDNSSGTSVLNKPETMNFAKEFASKHPWYDVTGQDEDSQIVSIIDQRLYSEGYDPSDSSYWEELSSRIKRRLPHRFKAPDTKNVKDGGKNPVKKQITGKPKGMGSSKSGGNGVQSMKGMPLSKERRQAMIDSGLQPGTKDWNDQVKSYQRWDKQHANK